VAQASPPQQGRARWNCFSALSVVLDFDFVAAIPLSGMGAFDFRGAGVPPALFSHADSRPGRSASMPPILGTPVSRLASFPRNLPRVNHVPQSCARYRECLIAPCRVAPEYNAVTTNAPNIPTPKISERLIPPCTANHPSNPKNPVKK